jgi:hypothetical protein
MKVRLTHSWILSTEHPKSSHGVPVLVHDGTRDAYDPGDSVTCYESWGPMTAVHAVHRMARAADLTPEQRHFVDLFTRSHGDAS